MRIRPGYFGGYFTSAIRRYGLVGDFDESAVFALEENPGRVKA
ncbi:MAG: hypothetical protein P4L70_01500 [Parasulfuritortus sp.]|jgi:hypothetical protein|nr:hypothetical protein [Parasulfuritortus sp.]